MLDVSLIPSFLAFLLRPQPNKEAAARYVIGCLVLPSRVSGHVGIFAYKNMPNVTSEQTG